MSNPNIILITLDALRADRFLFNPNNKKHYLFLENILNNSLYFKNCISNSPWTLPSHISMFTGLYPTQNNLVSNEFDKLSGKIPILTEILRDSGYYTVCFSENAFISKTYGLTRGFNEVFNVWDWNPWIRENYKLSKFFRIIQKLDKIFKRNLKSKTILTIWAHLKDRSEKLIKFIVKHALFEEVLFKLKNDSLKDLEKFNRKLQNLSKNKPFYLFFNFLTTHDPYIPFKKTYNEFNISIKDFKSIKNMIINPLKTRLKINIKSKRLERNQVKIIDKLYNACVYSCDFIIRKLFSILEKNYLLENSYVIITSDHGEHLGGYTDHYLWEHNTYLSLYDSLVKVPLIIFNHKFKNKIIENQVQLKDLFHTILHLIGLPEKKNKYLELEKSIVYQIDNNITPKYIFGEYANPREVMLNLLNKHRRTINNNLVQKIFNHLYFLRTDKYKLITFNNLKEDEFYHILEDPSENTNIINEDIRNYQNMKSKLLIILENINDIKEIEDIMTKKEKDSVKNIIKRYNISGI